MMLLIFICGDYSPFSSPRSPRLKIHVRNKKLVDLRKTRPKLSPSGYRDRGRWFFVADPAVIPAELEPRQNGRGVLFQLWSPVDVDKTPSHAIEIEGFVTTTPRPILQP